MFVWKDEFELGIDKIDNEHRKLFEIANKGYELLKNEFYVDKYDKIMDIIVELKEYAEFHFSEEEDYLASIGYKKLFTHKLEHDSFIKKVESFNIKEIDYDQDKYIQEMLDFVVTWIKEHILEKDREYID
ncbi:hemerythrin [Clostridium acetobutylicum]|uniref:Bacteriohemerythrin n=1 Tax=Clostridium acetobutylicum (strain ATCC 824 / DSM 792 / JCM 1419 / IAM 19013 / LMG 5710 / NBRC 13948 / NRRL B-527 / VKM B-1787 / 2291 / W) TaxID=272562 RepID=HEMTB_CLOAB|nr:MULTISPECIES: bacteriohemerythrin [Clostridium]Q97MX1.1 RecName: Full=Bacteriohemerythrin [Clostridium acetobutylicum ATCC 824]AAK78055.1 Predicted iron-binding protein, hemerythrin [Clostridium acetobutylicum ATCC 824]ADZ19111.1 iron-binding protein, hemerythrin [Clostridium acetobutylicum EA 2018]AEI31049.1 iron-binding protein, hemerythrin [Clostridium acetobutylicum DSM 1731]AWV81882.1 bacteriohemerythrin [Clostridium acetobutylicum]KHD34962.1 bacteriohemerythrin [Clostridium acetobuty